MQRSELGQTRDPIALVPGNPSAVRQSAVTMMRSATALSATGDGLKKIDDGGWIGQAADRFREVFDAEPGRWVTAGDAFTGASEALVGYACTLEWAQGQATEAIALWEQAENLTQQAEAEHHAAVDQAQADAVTLSAASVRMVSVRIPFHDPGEAIRQAAREKLDHARQLLDDAGHHAERIVALARDKAPSMPRWPGSGDNSDDGFTGGSLGRHQAAWCLNQGAVACGGAILLQRDALKRTNELADKYNWTTGQRNAFRHSYWMGLMTVHGFSYDETIALGKAHEKDTDTPGELPGSRDSNADLHNNKTGARIGVDVRPWYVGALGVGAREKHEKELEERLLPLLNPVCTRDGWLEIVEP